MSCGFNPNTSLLAGVDQATLQGWLSDAQAALAKYYTGSKEVTVIVTGGGQHREVTYDRANIGDLTNWILMLQAQLGIRTSPRRGMRLSY